jgi:hypothetical protein
MAKPLPAAAREFRSGPGQRRAARAFTLVELMVALGMGLALSAVLVQLLLAEGRQGAVLVRQWRERTFQRRTLDLVRDDLRRAVAIRVGSAVASPCPLAGREPVLQIITAEGAITYTVGLAPSPIWRGRVLMRCGPAFGLDGEPSQGASQNRVVIDALVAKGFRAEIQGVGQVRLGMEQEFSLARGGVHRLGSGVVVAAMAASPGP